MEFDPYSYQVITPRRCSLPSIRKARFPSSKRQACCTPAKSLSTCISSPHYSTYSSLETNPLLIFALTTPPTPKAGTILHILAAVLTTQFFFTIFHLSHQVTPPPARLYISKPSKCNGVLKSCTPAGARNCAIVCPFKLFSRDWLIFLLITGPSRGGRLKLAKIVRQSRHVNST